MGENWKWRVVSFELIPLPSFIFKLQTINLQSVDIIDK